jgi:hypothetical protein
MRFFSLMILAAAIAFAPAARADEIGGSGFAVPGVAASEWLWGIEGLVRTPVDLSLDFGVSFRGYEMDGKAIHDDRGEAGPVVSRRGTLEFEPESIEGGFRLAGGIGYWSCCVLIEPAMSFRANRPFGDERTDATPRVFDPNGGGENSFAEAEIRHGWDLAFGPQMTWMIRDDTPLLGRFLGGLPLVFFPYLGVSHIEWDAELVFQDGGGVLGAFDRNFEDDALLVGFDIDLPLPGSHSSFTHALTFGFHWVESRSDHDMGPFASDSIGGGFLPPGSSSGCGIGSPSDDQNCFNFDGLDGWRIGLYYRVTWNDFEGFVKRNLFGPLN